ncbi:MAG TPA: hypothetical protein VFZ24_11040 [Longimicrobiales bacterium]
MSALSWILWLLLSAAVGALSLWHYRRRETPGRGRMLLAALRAGAIVILLLILFDPNLPATGAGIGRGSQVLLDASLSMRLPADSSATRWTRARAEARARADDRPVLLFGESARPLSADALPDSAPGDDRTLLLPALQAAAEAGVRRVVVLTDGGIEDADAVARWAPRLGLVVETVRVGDDIANLSLVEASAPQWVDAGQPVNVDFAVAGAAADSVRVVVRRDGRVLARSTVPGAASGRLAAGAIELRLEPAEAEDGRVRLEVELENPDAAAADNVRTLYVQVGEEPAGVALVSFRPDWEPRFLAPVLERSLGLPLRAYLRSATGRYVRLAGGLEAGGPATEEDVRGAVERGQLVVLHGLGVDAPDWAHEAAGTAGHILIFPADDATTLPLPAPIGAAIPGDFFPSAAVPASPVAALLADLDVTGSAPLSTLRPTSLPEGVWAPLMVTRGRQGQPMPLAIAGGSDGRRWAVALGTGYWQWAFRGGAERLLYTRLWSALAGWLTQERTIAALPPVRPARSALPRGTAVPWVAPGIRADSMHVMLADAAGNVALDTVIAATPGDTVFSNAPAPGEYSYRVRAHADTNVTEGRGRVTIEQYSPEFARTPIDPARLEAGGTMVRSGEDSVRRGTPLHATAYPYLLLVLLLAAEWILRRRWGLR